MDHVAILAKKRKLLSKIISGEKTIESRWLMTKSAPYGRIHAGETIYFKDSGEPVTVRATISEVLQFFIPQTNTRELMEKYGRNIAIARERFDEVAAWAATKKYCVLVRLSHVQEIAPFDIDKKGFGLMAAWMCVDDIERIRKKQNYFWT